MRAAIDCDLRTSYVVTDDGQAVRAPTPLAALALLRCRPETVLFEIASPKDYTSDAGPAVAYHKRRWTIWNVCQAAAVHAAYWTLVSPSSAWTQGFGLEVRHKMAGCRLPKKDLREAEAMLWFYTKKPEDWVSLPEFLDRL